MLNREYYYLFQQQLKASPEQYWPLFADTNRFNKDTGLDKLQNLGKDDPTLHNAKRRLRFFRLGVPVTWIEEPFEWVKPHRFGVVRHYLTGPVSIMRVLGELTPLEGGGSDLKYHVWIRPRNALGLIAIPVQVGILSNYSFNKAFKEYDQIATANQLLLNESRRPRFAPGGRARLALAETRLRERGVPSEILTRIVKLVEEGDELTLSQMRPYVLADYWNLSRKRTLETFLWATREGMLDFRWQLLCPLCRVSKYSAPSLTDIKSTVHCDTCKIDFSVNFEQSVELTFRPNASIREMDEMVEFCIAGPQVTPHVAIQQLVRPGETRTLHPKLEEGQYRVRLLERAGGIFISVRAGGDAEALVRADTAEWASEEIELSLTPKITFQNDLPEEGLFVLEKLNWSDKVVTAAEVFALQLFRDLFANEALRPGEQVSVGSLAVVFTDLRESTRMYREFGDAPAFGKVMDHFDVLRKEIDEQNGAMVKLMGDSILAVFQRPASAYRAIARSQQILASPPAGMRPLFLKAAIHYGPCIAVTMNDRLDYFGTSLNITSRMVDLSEGDDIIISDAVRNDPEMSQALTQPGEHKGLLPVRVTLKGFDNERFDLWRVKTI